MDKAIIALVGFMLAVCVMAEEDGQSCLTSLPQAQQKCIDDHNVNITVDGNNVFEMCSKQDATKQAKVCVVDTTRVCFEEVSFPTELLPSVEQVTEGITFLCCDITSLNESCLKYFTTSELTRCMNDHGASGALDNLTDHVELGCATSQMFYSCVKQFMDRHCGDTTKNIFLQFYNEYERPHVCDNFDPEGDDYVRIDSEYLATGGASPFGLTFLPAILLTQILGLVFTC